MRKLLIGALALAGCTSNEPTWALDVMFVVPDGADVTGSQTWQIYQKAWQRSFKDKHYLCSVLVTFDGSAVAPDCPDCIAAWNVTPEVTDSDCDEALTGNPTFTSTTRIGFGPLANGGPHPDQSSIGYVDYGPGWEVHGWAFPDALTGSDSTEATIWNGTEPFAMAPSFAWQLGPDTSAASVSRLALDDAGDGTP